MFDDRLMAGPYVEQDIIGAFGPREGQRAILAQFAGQQPPVGVINHLKALALCCLASA